MRIRHILSLAVGAALVFLWIPGAPAEETTAFDKSVRPLLDGTCAGCHNAKLASGGLNMALMTAESLERNPDGWRRLLRRIRAGEMPPPGVPRPPADQIQALLDFVEGRLDGAQNSEALDPGRVTAHRLNRNEYTNTIRDLLGVDFRADKYFPTDDSGDGFDNISDVLTISPVLMEQYLRPPQSIAARAIGADPLPKPFEVEYAYKDARVRRVDPARLRPRIASISMPNMTSHRTAGRAQGRRSRCCRLLDGRQVCIQVDGGDQALGTGVLQSVFGSRHSASTSRRRSRVPRRIHRRRVRRHAGGEGRSTTARRTSSWIRLSSSDRFPHKWRTSRKKILMCDPASGRACVERILSTLARRAYRRPVSKREVAGLLHFVDWRRRTDRPRSRACNWRFRRCWFRRISCSASNATRTGRREHRASGFRYRAGFAAELFPVEFDARRELLAWRKPADCMIRRCWIRR